MVVDHVNALRFCSSTALGLVVHCILSVARTGRRCPRQSAAERCLSEPGGDFAPRAKSSRRQTPSPAPAVALRPAAASPPPGCPGGLAPCGTPGSSPPLHPALPALGFCTRDRGGFGGRSGIVPRPWGLSRACGPAPFRRPGGCRPPLSEPPLGSNRMECVVRNAPVHSRSNVTL